MDTDITRQWFERVEQQKASGKSCAAWCRENGIPYQNFLKWRRRLSVSEGLTRSSFIESKDTQDQMCMEITIHGVRCTFTKNFNRQSMVHLLEV